MVDTGDAPRTAESVPVILARMEGKLDRVNDKVDNVIPRVGKLEDRVTILDGLTLILTKNAEAEGEKKIALAAALKEAEEARRNQSEQTWTPVQRVAVLLGSLVGAIALSIQYYATIH
jgi:hypothetical protein